jgi:hypothetical protein
MVQQWYTELAFVPLVQLELPEELVDFAVELVLPFAVELLAAVELILLWVEGLVEVDVCCFVPNDDGND